MEIPAYQPFYIRSLEELRAEIGRLGLNIPLEEDCTRLAAPLTLGAHTAPNRMCAQPIAAGDARADGSPGTLTERRYRRYTRGRFGLIWLEKTAVGVPEASGQLCINDATLGAFSALVSAIRADAAERPVVILQLTTTQAGTILQGAALAKDAGFDGVDIQCPREILPEALARIRETLPGLLLSVRLCAYEGIRGGFGVSADDYRKADPSEPIRFVQSLRAQGLALLNVTSASPGLRGPDRGVRAHSDSGQPDEHPLMALERQLTLARTLREVAPGLPVVGSGFGWLRQFMPQVAAGAFREGMMDFAGLGRGALAHPSAPAEIFEKGGIDPASACMVCSACTELRAQGEAVGCVLRDAETYGPIYRQMRRFDADTLLAGAARCHRCEAAPCVTASPTRTDIPSFVEAFRNGDEPRAYEIIRARDPLPELTSRLSPSWLEGEGACIETALTGTPVPILDLQYAVAWRARERGATGVRVPSQGSGKCVGIVGGGPTGIAAAVRLIERGHTVHLYEQTDRLGGVPERLLARHRGTDGPRAEIDALLAPAIAAGRIQIHFGTTLGADLDLAGVRTKHDAVLVAVGLWKERALAGARGVIGALAFLEMTDPAVPARVAILAGGDSAMDAARAVQARGAQEIFIIFGGPRSSMHWHMPESWFATPGVQAMMNWQPLGYATDSGGNVCGVHLRHSELNLETTLPVAMVIEAMGLEADAPVRTALGNGTTHVHVAGALVNGGASISQCVAEGLAIAETIHQDISS